MELSHHSRYALGICAATPRSGARRILLAACAVAVLAGCSNAAQIAPIPGRTLDARIPAVKVDSPTSHPMDSPMSGEVLTGSSVHGTCHGGGGDLVARGKFSASGTASGPYPGTFTAHGTWTVHSGYFNGFALHESFTISSGKHTFSGRMWVENSYFIGSPCKPAIHDLTYLLHSRGWTGNAIANISKKSVSETFGNGRSRHPE